MYNKTIGGHMKIKLVSDLHLEGSSFDSSQIAFDENGNLVDVIILAGDISVHPELLDRHTYNIPENIPVIYVPGNHEYECKIFNDVIPNIKKTLPFDNWYILNNETIIIGDTRFICATLWSDLMGNGDSLYEANYEQAQLILKTQKTFIRLDDGKKIPFGVEHMLAEFKKSKEFIIKELSSPFSGKTVVVTHFAPHIQSTEKKYKLSGYWASDLSDIMDGVDIWCHGHIHSTSNYHIGKTKILANPRGHSVTYNLNQNLDFQINKTFEANPKSTKNIKI